MSKKQENILLLILGFVAALGPFSIDMYLPGFRAIAKDLDTDISQVALTLSSYFVGISVGQLVYGPILDRYGRKKPLLFGLTLYTIATIGCAMAPNVEWLIALRFIMALGGCAGMVASRAIIRDNFEAENTARAFSSLILVMGVAPIIAPSLGGYLIESYGWRSVFVCLVIITLILIAVIMRFLDESKSKDKGVSLRPVQVAKAYWKVMGNKQFVIYTITGSLATGAMFAYITDSSFIFMEVFNFEPRAYGLVFGGNASGFILGSQVNRWLLKRYNLEKITLFFAFGMSLVGLSLIVIYSLNQLHPYLFITLLFMFMFCLGFVNPNTTALSLHPFTNNAGIASALVGSFRMFAGAIAAAAIGFFHNGTIVPMILILTGASVIIASVLWKASKSTFEATGS